MGDDQKQHLELARDIAGRFNNLYGETFKLPEPVIPKVAARVMGFDDPASKMSKSATAQGHSVRLTDEDGRILKTFKRAVTDSGREIRFSDEPERAGVNNLLGIYRAITGKSKDEGEAHFADARGYGDLKTGVAEVVSGKENSNDGIHLYGSDGTHSTSMPSLPRPRWRAQAGVRCFLIRADLIWNEDRVSDGATPL